MFLTADEVIRRLDAVPRRERDGELVVSARDLLAFGAWVVARIENR